MATTIKTATTLQYRHNNGYDSILSVRDGAVLSRTTVTPAVFAEFAASGFDAADWDGADPEDAADPADYGDLVATYDGEVKVEDKRLWANRSEFYGR